MDWLKRYTLPRIQPAYGNAYLSFSLSFPLSLIQPALSARTPRHNQLFLQILHCCENSLTSLLGLQSAFAVKIHTCYDMPSESYVGYKCLWVVFIKTASDREERLCLKPLDSRTWSHTYPVAATGTQKPWQWPFAARNCGCGFNFIEVGHCSARRESQAFLGILRVCLR